MSEKIEPNLEEFRHAVRAMNDCPDQRQADALAKLIRYAAFAAGRTVEQIQPKTYRKRHPFEETTSKGWPL